MQECPIENHGVIGNLRTAALVNTRGGIDFYCHPDFDSPSVFAALLDADQGGCFRIEPQMESIRVKQLYLPDTNILVTRFLSADGVAELTDFMGYAEGRFKPRNQITRRLKVIRGDVRIKLRCAPRFNYARSSHSTSAGDRQITFIPEASGLKPLVLSGTVPLQVSAGDAVAEFNLSKGQTAYFSFGSATDEEGRPARAPSEKDFEELLGETSQFWREWTAQSRYQGRWRETVNRSALVLKLFSHHQYGCFIAAPTFGLPEKAGGARNWDYRFTWLRDSSFILYAFIRLGFVQEPRMHAMFLRNRIHEGLARMGADGPLRPVYRIDGSSEIREEKLENFAGYAGSRPVRIGNGAQSQLQLDVYGELMDAIYLAAKYGDAISNDGWNNVCKLLAWLQANWDRPDQGIWEMRGHGQHWLHSRLMSWVAFDRAVRLAQKRSLAGPLAAWLETRDAIQADIFQNFWSDKLKSFTQTRESETLDASVLLMPLVRFISPTDPRWLQTLAAIEERLSDGGLVYRYDSRSDGQGEGEGTFTACSFWLVECIARSGQVERAQLMFDRLLGHANHLGLYSEELGLAGEQLGNFPQALTHLALISAATALDRKLSGSKNEPWE